MTGHGVSAAVRCCDCRLGLSLLYIAARLKSLNEIIIHGFARGNLGFVG